MIVNIYLEINIIFLTRISFTLSSSNIIEIEYVNILHYFNYCINNLKFIKKYINSFHENQFNLIVRYIIEYKHICN
jgi:hypothetical protein